MSVCKSALYTYFGCLFCAHYTLVAGACLWYNFVQGGSCMPIRYKINVLDALKSAGYTTYKLRQEKILGERVIQQIRLGEIVSWKTIDTICKLLHCQPGDIVMYLDENNRDEDGFLHLIPRQNEEEKKS